MHFWHKLGSTESFPGGSVVKNLPANARDVGSVPGSRRSPGGGNGNPLQYSCLENPMDRGDWQAIVHGITKNQTRLSMGLVALQHVESPQTRGRQILNHRTTREVLSTASGPW